MIRTLEEAIIHAEETANDYEEMIGDYALDSEKLAKCAKNQRQIAAWLRELVERRKAPEIIYCHECKHFQCNMRFDGYVPKGADAYECRRGCGGCDPMDYCSYGERAERRTDETN